MSKSNAKMTQKQPPQKKKPLPSVSQHRVNLRWIFPVAFFAILVLLAWSPAEAAPSNQTVPIPPKEATSTAVPTATPAEDGGNDDDGSNDNEDPAPEETPETSPEEPVDDASLTGSVTVSVLNVRSGPDVTFDVQGTVFEGEVLDILGRTEDDEWWQICCAFGQNEPGWVDSQYIAPDFNLAESAELLPIIRIAENADATPGTSAMADGAEGLLLEIRQTPTYVWQSQAFRFQFIIVNNTGETATEVELRDDLPADLLFGSATASANGVVSSATNDSGGTLLSVVWPQLAPEEEAMVTVDLQIPDNLADGYVINNLAVVGAANAKPTTAGIAIGMPPSTLPSFK